MTLTELIATLRSRRVSLRAAGGRLYYRGPRGAMDAPLREAVELHQDGLMAAIATCPGCRRPLNDGRCWRCSYRLCACGRNTGSAFIGMCFLCQAAEDQ